MVDTGWPVLVSLSNKDFVGETLDLPVGERLTGTLAATAVCALAGARIYRVHQVRADPAGAGHGFGDPGRHTACPCGPGTRVIMTAQPMPGGSRDRDGSPGLEARVIVAAALCASPPLLHPALTGRETVLPDLRAACAEAVARLLREDPEVITVVGPAPATGEWDAGGRLDAAAFAPGFGCSSSPAGVPPAGVPPAGVPPAGVPPPLSVPGRCRCRSALAPCSWTRADTGGSAACSPLARTRRRERAGPWGPNLPPERPATALLVMGDGSARRTLKAPGHLDPRAEPFDAEVERAVRAGRLGALLELDEALARDLMATGRPAWQVLAGAMLDGAGANGLGADGVPVTEVLYRDDPFGVAYLVACLLPRR